MSPWFDRLLDVVSIGFGWLQRLYGVFFVALGALFLYWAGRGLLAYEHGVRAAWSDPLACLAGVAAGVLSLWAGSRIVRSGLSFGVTVGGRWDSEELAATLEAADKLQRTDPIAAQQLLDSYFTREAAATDMRRSSLRQRAPYDLKAALALREELQDDLNANTYARSEMLKGMPVSQHNTALTQIDQDDQNLRAELSALEVVITRLQAR